MEKKSIVRTRIIPKMSQMTQPMTTPCYLIQTTPSRHVFDTRSRGQRCFGTYLSMHTIHKTCLGWKDSRRSYMATRHQLFVQVQPVLAPSSQTQTPFPKIAFRCLRRIFSFSFVLSP